MTQCETVGVQRLARISECLAELRRSFDDDVRCAPPETATQTETFLLLTLSGETYGFPVMHALEVVPLPPLVPVPGTLPAVLGIVNYRGRILSVTTIHGLLGLTVGKTISGSKMIVTKGLALITGILADSVRGMAEVRSADIQPLPMTVEGSRARVLSGQVYINRQLVSLLNTKQFDAEESLTVSRDISAT